MMALLFYLLLSCTIPQPEAGNYNFSSPVAVIVLPDTLREVSGLTWIGGNSFACIQDENGILFIYDISRRQLTGQYTFNIDGDYEGIAVAGNSIYILRSDGMLFEAVSYNSPQFIKKNYVTGIPADNNEGLCLDAKNNRLLIGCKSKIGKGSEYKDKRAIYGFDLNSKKLTVEPVFEFDINDLKQFAKANHIKLHVKEKKSGEEPVLKFRISAIGIHPVNGKLYVLSASDFMLFVFDQNGKIEHMELLNRKMFNKAEGLAFFNNGDLLISNEGQGKVPTLLKFGYE